MKTKFACKVLLVVLVCGCGKDSISESEVGIEPATSGETTKDVDGAGKLENQEFEKLGALYLDKDAAMSPVYATWLGDHRFDSEIDQLTEEARSEALGFHKEMLRNLEKIDKNVLTKANQIDFLLLTHTLKSSIWSQTILREWEWNPTLYTGLAGSGIYNLMAREFAPLETRLTNVIARLEKYPAMFEQIRQTLVIEKIPLVHAQTAVKQNRGVLSIIDNTVKPQLEKLPPDKQKRLQSAIDIARVAVEKHQNWLEKEVVPNAKGDFRLGEKLFDEKLAFTLNSTLDRKAILEQATSELARVRGEMYEVSLKVTNKAPSQVKPTEEEISKTIRAALEIAYKDAPARGEILDVAKKGLKMAEDFIRKKDLMTVPNDPVEIIEMPEFQRGFSLAYCDSPGPLDAGQKTFYAVAPIPEDWTDKHVRSYLREYNTRSVYELTIHEAMPGHFLQLAHSNTYPSKLRAVLSSGVFIEGWAIYTEQLMWRQGFLDGDPLMQLIAQKWLLRVIANAIIDQGIHTGNMTEEQAMKVMVEDTFQEEAEATAKWTRARLSSTQLSTYFVGISELRALRRDVEKVQGDEFSLKKYHDSVISFGSPPTRFVRAMILDQPITK